MAEDYKHNESFLGVEKELLEEFLILLRDKYPLVDKANYFLETHGISGINVAITNQRDALSHFVTFLSEPEKTSYEERKEQISDAEEHLRRATIECYQDGVTEKLETLKQFIDQYKQKVLTIDDLSISTAPNLKAINARLSRINLLVEKGRAAKARNKWDEKWEEGVNSFIKAADDIAKFHEGLETYFFKAQQIQNNRSTRHISYFQIMLGVGLFALGVIVTMVLG